jgi:hypothetical protein
MLLLVLMPLELMIRLSWDYRLWNETAYGDAAGTTFAAAN